jgi:Ca-activated chloride channel homolog
MSFIWPGMLLSMLAIPLLIGFYLYLQRRRAHIAIQFENLAGSPVPRSQPGRLRHIPPAMFLLGVTLQLVALARPEMTLNLPRLEGTVILAFDVSGSMAADDLEPNRLAAAKVAASEFVQRQPATVQIGVVAFSESGLAVQAPTNDQGEILASLNRLEPQQGTSLGYGILSALEAIVAHREAAASPSVTAERYGSAIIVLITDGENTSPPDPFQAAYTAAELGVQIFAIGIGSPSGAILNLGGYSVHTQLNEVVLEQIAGLTGGHYYTAGSADDLREAYDHLTPELVVRPEKLEVTALFAGASILCLLLGGGLMLAWFGRLP